MASADRERQLANPTSSQSDPAPAATASSVKITAAQPVSAGTEQAAKKPSWKERLERVKTFVIEQWLPLIFAVAITWALAWPVPGRAVVGVTILGNVHLIQEINMVIVFFLSGLGLNTQELSKVKGSKLATAYGFFAILLLTPCLGFAMREIPLEPEEFSIGLVIFCVVPTTLGIGVALVRSCKGNEAIALLLTVGTNMLGVFSMPLELKLLFVGYEPSNPDLDIKINIPDLLVKLLITILVPSVLGKLAREFIKPAEKFAKEYRIPLGMFSTFNLAFIVWQTLSGARDLLFESKASMIISVIVLSASIYLFYLLLNYIVVVVIMKVPTVEAVSITVMASQKSAPVAVTVISYITGTVSTQGLLAIPSIVGQLAQIFLGAAMAPAIAKRVQLANKRAAEAAKSIEAETKAEAAKNPEDVALSIKEQQESSSADLTKDLELVPGPGKGKEAAAGVTVADANGSDSSSSGGRGAADVESGSGAATAGQRKV